MELQDYILSGYDAKRLCDAILELKDNSFGFDLDEEYPVGYLYFSTKPTSPAQKFGGTWLQHSGQFLYCGEDFSTGNGTGNDTGSTVLTASQSGLPYHNHPASYSGANFYIRGGLNKARTVDAGSYTSCNYDVGPTWGNTYQTTAQSHQIERVNIGGTVSVGVQGPWNASEGHTHTIPYMSVYCWERVE